MDPPSEEPRLEEEVEEMDDEEEEEEEEVEDEEEEVEEEEEEEEGDHLEVTVGRRSGRGLTLKTLLKERVLEPGEGSMTINYLGNKFKGDLLPDGRIRSQETNKIFGTPSAWAIYCKKIVNPDKKSGCGWASVRYRGKKLDTYKNNWYRQKRLEYEKEEEEMEEDESGSECEEVGPHEQEIIEFDQLGNRNPNHDPSTMIELTTFQSIGRMQPFNITMSSSAMAVIDVHSHLSTSEVVGYLAGQWDVNNHNLIVSHAFPVRCRLGDAEKGPVVEQDLYGEMAKLKLSLVGWYHTHPCSPNLPSLRDIDSQLDYEMKMKGYNDASYTPVLGIIVSPYQKSPVHDKGIPHANGNASGFWVMPPPENKPLEYGRPMSMQFTVVQDAFIPKEALLHMSEVVKFYKNAPDSVTFANIFEENYTFWHKLKNSLRGRVPKDHFQPLIDFLTKIIDEKLPEDDIPIPVTTTASVTNTSPVLTAHLPSTTTVSILECKTNIDKSPENMVITKDLGSSVSNLFKSSMNTDIIALLSDSADTFSKEKECKHSVTISLNPSYNPSNNILDKYDDQATSTLIKPERKTPPKSYSPLFQLPLPPLFSIDSGKQTKDSTTIRSLFQPINLDAEDKRQIELSPLKGVSPHVDDHKQVSESEAMEIDTPTRSKHDVSDLTSKLKNSIRDASEAVPSSSGYLDLSISGSKDYLENKNRKTNIREESPKPKESKENQIGSIDMSSWFTQAKFMRDAFPLPPHERENPFTRDLPPLFSSSEFLTSHWNPTAAAAALHLSRDHSNASLKAAFQDSGIFPHKSPLSLSADSKPTYHSDVPILLKKKDESSSSVIKSNSDLQDSKESRDLKWFLDPRESKDYRALKEMKEYRDIQEHKETREHREARDHRSPREFREPKEYREFKDPKDFREFKDPKDYKEFKDPKDYREFKDPKDFKDPKEYREFKDPKDYKEFKDPKDYREFKDPKDYREFKDPKDYREFKDPKDYKEFKDPKDYRDFKDPKDYREFKDPKDFREFKDPKDYREFKEPRDFREYKDPKDYRDIKDLTRDSRDLVRESKELGESKEARESRELRVARDLKAAMDSEAAIKDFLKLKDIDVKVTNDRKDIRDFREAIDSLDPNSFKDRKDSKESFMPKLSCKDLRNPITVEATLTSDKADPRRDRDSRSPKDPLGLSDSKGNIDFQLLQESNKSRPGFEEHKALTVRKEDKDICDNRESVGSRELDDARGSRNFQELREHTQVRDMSVSKPLINVRDPKSLIETREPLKICDLRELTEESGSQRREESSFQRHLQSMEELPSMEQRPIPTPPLFTHKNMQLDENRDFN